LEEFSDMLSPDDVEEIRENLATCKELVDRATIEDFEELKQTVTRLETAAHRIADAMYASDEE
jgi:hypothetical protein